MKKIIDRLINIIVYGSAYILINIFFILYFRRSVKGRHHVPRKGSLIVASNHASFLDPPLVGSSMPREMSYLARESLMNNAFKKYLLEKLNCIALDRNKGDIKAIKTTIKSVASGKAVLLFPEGTRTTDGTLGEGKAGVGFIVHKSKAPVLPVYCDGTYEILPRGTSFPRPRKVRIYIGEPLRFENYDNLKGSQEIYTKITANIMSAITRLKSTCYEDKRR